MRFGSVPVVSGLIIGRLGSERSSHQNAPSRCPGASSVTRPWCHDPSFPSMVSGSSPSEITSQVWPPSALRRMSTFSSGASLALPA